MSATFAGDSIKQIQKEANVLGVQNFTLIDVIAETRGLQAYIDALQEENYNLNGGGLVPSDVTKDSANDQYDDEIKRLQEMLSVCQERERAIDYEKQQAEQGLRETEAHNRQLDDSIEKLVKDVDLANEEANQVNNMVKELDHEIEELESTLQFRQQLHRSELESVAKYVRDYNEAVEENSALPSSNAASKHNLEKSVAENLKDDKKLIESLEAFANEYQKLLDMAYAKEKYMLTEELQRLEETHNFLRNELERLRNKQAYMEDEIKQLKIERKELERQYVEVATKRNNDRKDWADERKSLEDQIARIKDEINKKEIELAALVEIDNKVVKESIALEMEIQGYRAMMDNERN